MSTSAFLSTLRTAGRQHINASTLGATPQETGSHVFRIHRFTQVREKVANGTGVYSGLFSVGGHDWRIQCFPNGKGEQTQGSISVYLQQTSHAKTGGATATFKMSILDKSCRPSVTESAEGRLFRGGYWGWNDFIKLQDLDKEKHLEDDCLSVLCDVAVDLGLRTDDYTGELTKATPPFQVHGLAEAIWKTQEADVKIEVADGQTFPAHRWVLESGSPVFKADLALASSNGTVAAELRMDDMDADVCKALLQFMYTGSPPQKLKLDTEMAERLLLAADRYELESLKLVCEEALEDNIDTSSVAARLTLAERHRCSGLREACMEFLSSPDILDTILASPDGFEKLKTASPSAIVDLIEKKDIHMTSLLLEQAAAS